MSSGRDMGVSPKIRGPFFGGPYNKDCRILVYYIGIYIGIALVWETYHVQGYIGMCIHDVGGICVVRG